MSAPVICDCGRAVIPAGSVVCVKGGINHRRGLCVDRVTRVVQPSSSALPGPTLAEGLPYLFASGEVGTGAGEGAPRQDTGSAWVTRSTDCPEAPAQAHLPAAEHEQPCWCARCPGDDGWEPTNECEVAS